MYSERLGRAAWLEPALLFVLVLAVHAADESDGTCAGGACGGARCTFEQDTDFPGDSVNGDITFLRDVPTSQA